MTLFLLVIQLSENDDKNLNLFIVTIRVRTQVNPKKHVIFENTWKRKTKNKKTGTSLVAQWLRIRLPIQWTWVRVLVLEDPTCHEATMPLHHNY